MNRETAKVILNRVPEEIESACRDAAESCPVDAISIEQEGSSET
jgi:ferredoxin